MGLVTAGTYEMTVLSFNHPQRLYSLPLGLSVGAYMMSLMHFIIPVRFPPPSSTAPTR